MLVILNILWTNNFRNIIMKIYITKAKILTITTITITIVVSHGKRTIIFIVKKIVPLITIQIMSNKKQKTFKDKIMKSIMIKVNIIYFWPIIKVIHRVRLIIFMKKSFI